MASKKNVVKGKFLWIVTFDHEGPAVIKKNRDLTVGLV